MNLPDPTTPAPQIPNALLRPGEAAPLAGALPRRDFLRQAALGSLSLSLLRGPGRAAQTGDGAVRLAPDHFIPVDKGLKPAWVEALFAKGLPEQFHGRDLDTIGMPVGGVGAGQMYLTGDGRLVYWDIFNQNHNTGYGGVNWKEGRRPEEKVQGGRLVADTPVRQGFAVQVRHRDQVHQRILSKQDFPDVHFRGEYPIAEVDYLHGSLPVRLRLEAFSPFIPLNAADSALPVTILNLWVENRTPDPVEVTLAGWLSNAVCRHSAADFTGRMERIGSAVREDGWIGVNLAARPRARAATETVAPPAVFADFEGGSYGNWKVEGAAFGTQPAAGTLPNQQAVSGFQGRGLVNTFLEGDVPQGRLTSPAFEIQRPFISFLIGGGSQAGQTCLNLIVDGQVARTATGKDNERLLPHNWDVTDLKGKRATLQIVDTASGGWGHLNVDQIEFRDTPVSTVIGELPDQADFGTMGLFALDAGGGEAVLGLPAEREVKALFAAATGGGAGADGGVVRVTRKLGPAESVAVPFLIAWCFPNMFRETRRVGNAYANRFTGAVEVARYVRTHWKRLTDDTRLWRDTYYYRSSLPCWLLDRVHSTAANLATTTCQWWQNGRFWAWEGGGCCHGTCGHVWNYAHTMARLFPELERSVRTHQDFADGVGLHADGSIGFRGEGWDLWAGDSQGGYILKAYREHQCSADEGFLKQHWPQIRRAVEFLFRQDGNADGLIEGVQHQTYDENYYGANTFVGALYLGALRAAEEMARELGEDAFATRCREVFEAGRRHSMERLFNGEYFIQQVDLKQHPDWQYADGCLADQLFGQGWAHQVGLGYLYPEATVRKAIESVWKYCWAPDISAQNAAHPPERWFASQGDAGLFTCTWPRGKHLGPKSTRYRDELWTGIEYQVAGHLAWEGLVTEALAICRAIHDRYHPRRYNPYNEIECGDHYARALASWGVLTGLAGFEYHGPQGHLGFAPRLTPEQFRCAFTGAEGWGTIGQTREAGRQTNTVDVRWGRLRLRTLAFEVPDAAAFGEVRVTVAGKPVASRSERSGRRIRVLLDSALVVQAGETVEVVMT